MVFTDFPATKKSRLQKSKVKTLLIAFFDNNGIIHKEFVPAGQIINAAFYQSVLNRLPQRIRRNMVTVLEHPPYFPDLAPADFFLFPRLKAAMKGERFADVNAIKDRVTGVLRSIPQEAFADSFQKLYERSLIKKASFVVIMTDYETFGLVFSCQKLAFANRQAAFIMSRSPKLAQIYIDKIRNRLNGYGINHFALSNINQTCTPYDENTWEIKVNPTTLTLKGIAKTIGHHVKYGFQQTGRAVGNGINSVAQWTSGLFGVKPRRDPK
ncbi:hypothetical protein ANN_19515 [Periplaneta americana]|uniref:Uncharacterized protein n=1 Tax=Periplaneta americana TaxID=6978 RepID=A0ABQ8SAE7_PERAM|nr:hypothetical protein ANN_19515 [Periplaneta americana]